MSTDTKQETTAPVVADDTIELVVDPKPRKPRRVVNKASVVDDFSTLLEFINDEIERLRAGVGTKPPTRSGIKFLRSVNKRVKTLNKDAERAFKTKPKTNRSANSQSGFKKPVPVSDELADFAGWEHGVLKSRVDTTKVICAYIKEHDLQNPEDRRLIVPDAKLASLLSYDHATQGAETPLTYFRVQTFIQRHFPESRKNREARESLEADGETPAVVTPSAVVAPTPTPTPVAKAKAKKAPKVAQVSVPTTA